MRIELHIDRLVVDDAGAGTAAEFASAISRELRRVLARDPGLVRVTAPRAMSVPHLRTVLAPPAAGTSAASSAGRALGAALAATMTPHHPGR